MILLGQAGSGRRTLARLAAHIQSCELFESPLKDANGPGGGPAAGWRDMLKQGLHAAGVSGRKVVLALRDVGRAADTMLDDVTHLLSTGHLPGLFKVGRGGAVLRCAALHCAVL